MVLKFLKKIQIASQKIRQFFNCLFMEIACCLSFLKKLETMVLRFVMFFSKALDQGFSNFKNIFKK
jgi:hypothetical protein